MELACGGARLITVVPGRAQREPGIHNPKKQFDDDSGVTVSRENDVLWLRIPAFAGMTLNLWLQQSASFNCCSSR